MTGSVFSDPTLRLMVVALDALSKRQAVISHNIANIDTPGFLAKEVPFKERLTAALQSRNALPLVRTDDQHLALEAPSKPVTQVTERQGGTPRVDGNTVDINREMVDLVEASLKYRAVAQLASKRLSLIKTVVVES